MANALKTYPAPWEGHIILACRKCQKKLKRNHALRALAKLKKTVKRYNKELPGHMFEVINVSCMDLCPKDGVAVCDPRTASRLSILRSVEDIKRFI
jgi:predicted metal-binding protein